MLKTLDSVKEYMIGWITALDIELAAAIALLDERHDQPKDFVRSNTDDNVYTWGRVSSHNVTIACLLDRYGLTSATTTVERLLSSLPHIKIGLLVGIGAGTNVEDIRLGDVAVSQPEGTTGGVVQYDSGKASTNGIRRIGMLSAPPGILLNALKRLRAEHELHESKIPIFLQRAMQDKPRFAQRFGFPGIEKDYVPGTTTVNDAGSTEKKIPSLVALSPLIHYGTIASGNLLVKDSKTRDEIIAAVGQSCICLEMEAAGLMNNFPCLVIRGICDYADNNKNDDWQRYASATAAAFAKELLQYVPVSEIKRTEDIKLAVQGTQTDIERLNADMDQNEQEKHEENVSKLIQSLFSHSHVERKDRNPTRVKNTCKWFTEHKLFQEWNSLSGTGPQTLWVSADPGCGKSVLARYLVDEVLPRYDRVVCFFFFKDDFLDQKTGSAAARTILHQLFTADRSLVTVNIVERLKNYGDKIDFSVSWRVFLEACENLNEDIVCVFDALDECEEGNRSEIVQAICGSSPFPKLPARIKIMALSRPYFDIKNDFDSIVSEISILHLSGDNDQERKTISEEIDLVIKHRIELFCNKRRLDQKDHDFLLGKLVSIPQKTYLWAHLTMASLEDTPGFTRGKARQVCEHLPPTVDAAYEKILNRSPDEVKTRLLLQIVIAAKQPLSVDQMCLLLALDGTQRTYAQLEEFKEPEDRFKSTVRELCGLFVIVVDHKIYLLHQTAREFLLNEMTQEDKAAKSDSLMPHNPSTRGTGTYWKQSFSLPESHYILAERCVRFIIMGKYHLDQDLCRYCAFSLNEHVRQSEINPQNNLGDNIYNHFLKYSKICRPWWKYYYGETELWYERLRLKRGRKASEIDDVMWNCLTYNVSTFSLKMACFYGLASLVKTHLKGKWRQNWSLEALSQALWYGLYSTDVGTVKALLQEGADPNMICRPAGPGLCDYYQQFPLYIAVKQGMGEAVELLLLHGAEVNSLNEDEEAKRNTPLHAAVRSRLDQSIITKLVSKGADIRMVDSNEKNALACFYDRYSHGEECSNVMRKLLWGDQWNHVDKHGKDYRTALSYVAERNCIFCLQDLLRRKASVNFQDVTGKIPLHWALDKSASKPIVTALLQAGADIHLRDNDGRTPILAYAGNWSWSEDVIRTLIDAGADVHDVDNDASTCLHFVKNLKIFKDLMVCGLDINSRDKFGRTPLHSIFTRYLSKRNELTSAMLKYGADSDALDNEGRSAIMYYCSTSSQDCRGLHEVFWDADSDYAQKMNPAGWTALHYLAWEGKCLECGHLLLEKGADIDAQDIEGYTPLARACRKVASSPTHSYGHYSYSSKPSISDWFLQVGADVNLANADGDTSLHLAFPTIFKDLDYSEEDFEEYMKLPKALISHGANINAQNAEGNTPTMQLCMFKGINVEALRFMLSNGADPKIKDSKGRTALDHLKARSDLPKFSDSEKFRACVKLLEEAERRDELDKTVD